MLSTTENSQQVLQDLVHDLRQPLSNIETSAYFLNLLVGSADPRVQEQLQAIQQQVEQAAGLLSQVAAILIS